MILPRIAAWAASVDSLELGKDFASVPDLGEADDVLDGLVKQASRAFFWREQDHCLMTRILEQAGTARTKRSGK